MAKSTIRKWIGQLNDDEALAQLQALGAQAVPDLCRAYAALEWFEASRAQWLNRILAATATDPVGVALSLLDQEMDIHIHLELAWMLRRFVQPGDRERLRQALEPLMPSLTADPDDPFVWPHNGAAVSVLVEGLGLVGQPDDMPWLRRLLAAAQGVLKRYRQDAFSYNYFAAENLPLAAAAAAALLAISERAGLRNEKERGPWRQAAVTAALAQDRASNSATNAPLPFLFAQAPREAALLLHQVAKKAQQVDPLLSDLREALLVGREIGVPALIAADEGALPWLDVLAARADPHSYGPGCVLDIRSFLQPAAALAEVMAGLNSLALSPGYVAHSSQILRQNRPVAEIAAIVMEACFVAGSRNQEGLAGAAELGKELQRLLRAAHLPVPQGWAWAAPPGQLAGVATPPELHRTLCAVAHRCAQAARAATAAEAQAALAPLPALLTHALVRHAYYRNLLVAVAQPPAAPRAVLWAALEGLASEPDPDLAGAVLTMAQKILRRRAGPVYLALLQAPALQADLDLAERLVPILASAAPPGAGEALLAFARQIHWGTERGDYGVDAAITEALGSLGVSGAIPGLLPLVGHSGLGSRSEVALLRLAVRDPQALGEADFRRAFAEVMADGFAGYDPDLLGEQARAEIVRVLEQEPLAAPLLGYVCRFLYLLYGKGDLPPRALPLLLARWPAALASAQAHPGEAWEDRNWGGYHATAQETTAEWMSGAIQSVAGGSYSREGWRTLIGGLLRLESLDPARIPVTASGVFSFDCHDYDLYAQLAAGLLRLDDAAIRQALEQPAPRAALAGVYQVLGGDQRPGG